MTKKQLIIEEATRIFTEKGYYGLGLKELLDACDIPKGSFYYYFPKGKKQLATEVLEASYNSMENGIRTNAFGVNDLKKTFLGMCDRLSTKLKNDKYFQSLTMTFLSIESVYLDDGINIKCRELYTRWQNLYKEEFINCGYSEEVALEKAQSIFALIHGSLISSWIKQDDFDLMLIKKSIERIIDND